MKPNRTCPQFEKSETQEEDCYGECCSCRCCTRRAACISGILLSCMIFSAVVLVLVFAIPEPPPINRDCRTPQNGSGFLCDDRVTCIPPSDLCNGAPNCPSGTDEDKLICNTSCPSCGAEWWACIPVLFQYCECIPQSLCRDGRQHCFDWSDEYICIKD
ncbi:low-density lipoprotein receptor class A domain-containing protein 1-like isoform X3 [Myxocyprinus asiaticus]|uniref:low-density lipoprotein receptor class A domain-containing protein 1-like isoform X3 n=1 Tax=Myxocyprinus asiaticus TaxID=70543 RepID=UPI0022239EE4|nr:low-density lipoprotein receptor class A domain-containing protein 1-like isoform X3 [Myxocyprinus asiaticus]